MECVNPEHYHNFNLSIGVDSEFFAWVSDELWGEIIDNAWHTGDPGLWFSDTTNKYNPTPWLGDYHTTNPCGETPLLNNEACVLGSIGLTHYLYYNDEFFHFDIEQMLEDIPLMIEALDNMIDVAVYPSEDIETATKLTRKVGLGVMGLADVLTALELHYDTSQARNYAGHIQSLIQTTASEASWALGNEKGMAPAFEWYGDSPLHGRRNAVVTTQAPTGTISLSAGMSGGIEPVFALEAESRRFLNGDSTVHVETIKHPFYQWLQEHELGRFNQYWREAENIHYTDHIKMQACIQQHVENAVSKTINMANHVTREDVDKAFRLAYELGCKGITVYRDESKGEAPWQRVKETCPNCGVNDAYRSEGCLMCPNCGSKCDLP
jgi:ribonucleoside-diphosphate reductase alpha chain